MNKPRPPHKKCPSRERGAKSSRKEIMKYLQHTTSDGVTPFDQIKRAREDGTEYWSARDLMPLMGYARWEDFYKITRRAEASAKNSGQGGFSVITEKAPEGGRPREDFPPRSLHNPEMKGGPHETA